METIVATAATIILFVRMQRSNGIHATNGYHMSREVSGAFSDEAQILRRLLRNHAARQLSKRNLQLPASLANDTLTNAHSCAVSAHSDALKQSNAATSDVASRNTGEATVNYEQLEIVFDRMASRFEQQYQAEIEGFVANMQITPSSIDVNVLGVIREIFADQRVTWGRIVALTGFITNIAVECCRAELAHAVEPLIDQTCRIAEEQVVPFIRDNRGWMSFVEFFDVEKSGNDFEQQEESEEEQSGAKSNLSKLATYAAGAIGVGMLTAFLARR